VSAGHPPAETVHGKEENVSDLSDKIRKFLEEISTDELEDRVVEYVVREVGNGRKLEEVLRDPYVRNRVSEEKLRRVLETPEVIEAIERGIQTAFERKDFGFTH
jgi:hypothetical protein